MDNKENYLLNESSSSPWISFTEYNWHCITKNQKLINYKKNQVIYNFEDESEYIYVVDNGRICLSVTNSLGMEKSFFIAEKGCVFGESSVLNNIPYKSNAIAVTDSYLYKISKQDFFNELKCNNEFTLNILKFISKKEEIFTTQIEQLSFNDARYRVYYAIVNLVKKYSFKSSSGYKLTIKFTHQEMANLIGISRVTVSNIISDLINEGILQKSGGYYIINDLGSITDYISLNG